MVKKDESSLVSCGVSVYIVSVNANILAVSRLLTLIIHIRRSSWRWRHLRVYIETVVILFTTARAAAGAVDVGIERCFLRFWTTSVGLADDLVEHKVKEDKKGKRERRQWLLLLSMSFIRIDERLFQILLF